MRPIKSSYKVTMSPTHRSIYQNSLSRCQTTKSLETSTVRLFVGPHWILPWWLSSWCLFLNLSLQVNFYPKHHKSWKTLIWRTLRLAFIWVTRRHYNSERFRNHQKVKKPTYYLSSHQFIEHRVKEMPLLINLNNIAKNYLKTDKISCTQNQY